MSASEAWLITALGIGTVFFGLVLCILFINLFGKLSGRISWTGAHTPSTPPNPVVPVEAIEQFRDTDSDLVTPEVQVVIATVLEIEQRLYRGCNEQRLTFRRNNT